MEKQFKRFSLWGMLYLCITLTACSDNEEEFHSYLVADSKSESLFANGINVDAGDILQSVSFRAGEPWTANLSGNGIETWCSISPTSGRAVVTSTINISFQKNETEQPRNATLTILSGELSKQISITQAAKAEEPLVVPEGLSYSPEVPNADQALTIYFKANNQSALYGYTNEVYAHIGVVSEGDWQFVPASWDKNLDKCKMQKMDTNTWSITLSPNIREWFGSGTTPINQIGLVIRSSDGTKKGIEADSFIPVTDTKYKGFTPAVIVEKSMPSGLQEGINISGNNVTFVLYDKDSNGKHKDYAHIIGDFNNWTLANDETSQMYRDNAAGCWWITLNNLDATKEYAFQYYVGTKGGENIRLADPYTEKILDPSNDPYINGANYTYPNGAKGIVSTFQIQQESYTWKINDFKIAHPDKMVIYELLLRDFTQSGNLAGAMEKLDYLKALGVNAIELMPTQEFSGNISWGYNPIFYFAMDKAYGTKKQYKEFIDACHEKGMAVILDVVYNQADYENPFVKMYWDGKKNQPAANNPWMNETAPHAFSVFYDFDHESPLTRNFVKRNLKFLLEEYKLDGFRFDLTKGFTSKSGTESTYDASRIAILKDYNNAIKEVKADAYVIFEHFCTSREENELAQGGMHMWREMNNAYCQTAMGYSSDSDFSGMYESTPAWVGFMESHDKDRMAYKQLAWPAFDSLKGDNNLENRMKQLAVNAAFMLTVPGPKMIWQFGEMGYDVCIFANSSGNLTVDYGKEDYKTDPKPTHWEYLDNSHRKGLHHVYTQLMKMRNEHPELFDCTGSFTWKVGVSNWANGRSLYSESTTGKKLVVLGNFTDATTSVSFPATTGTWRNFTTGEEQAVEANVSVPAHSYIIYTNF